MRIGTYYRVLVLKELDLLKAGRAVLDVGCYDGFLLSQIDSDHKVGIDIDVVARFSDVTYIRGDFLAHEFAGASFDIIFALDILEHVADDGTFVQKLVSLLKLRGIAVLSTPSAKIRIFPRFLQAWVDKRWGHVHRRGYSREGILHLMKTEDLDIISWNCPMFRLMYLPLSLVWRTCLPLGKIALHAVVKVDSRFRHGDRGFYYCLATRNS